MTTTEMAKVLRKILKESRFSDTEGAMDLGERLLEIEHEVRIALEALKKVRQ